MLYFIVAWTCLIMICCLIGTTLMNVLQADSFERVGDRTITAVWLGVVILANSLLATSLILPLSSSVGALICISLCALSLLSQRTRNEITAFRSKLSQNIIWGFFALELGIAALTTQQVTWIDTGLYHYGVIQWLSKFGAVPGVALLFSQLGFTSSWFALAAPLNAEIFDSRVSAITNGLAFLIAVLHFLTALAHCFTNKAQLSDWFVIIFSAIVLPFIVISNLMRVILVSPSPDLPIILLVEVVAWSTLIASNPVPSFYKVKASILDAPIIPLVLSAGAVTIKLIALPLLFVSGLFYIFVRGFDVRRVLMGISIIILLLLPMLSVGAITSGCPLYPSSFLCLDLSWSPTEKVAKTVAEGTHGWTTWYGSPPPDANYMLWLLSQWASSTKLNQVMALLVGVSTLAAPFIVRTLLISRVREQLWILAMGITGITFLMLTTPFFRFGLGYLILLPALLLAKYCREKLGNVLPSLFHKFVTYYRSKKADKARLVTILFLGALILVGITSSSVQNRLILPPQLPSIELLQKQVNDIAYFSPKNSGDLCWATKLPCAFELQDVKLREPARGIEAGFVYQKYSPKHVR